MHSVIEELAVPFERVSDGEAEAVLSTTFGITGASLTRLDTERDDSFRVRSAHGDFALKIAHPADDPLVINLQTAALAHVADTDPRVPLQRFLPSIEGDIEPEVRCANGDARIARVLTWLEGEPLYTMRPDAEQLQLLGQSLGRVNAALASFRHPASGRVFAWDVVRLPELRDALDAYPSPEVSAARALFEEVVAPRLGGLPRQVVFNDFHQGNILVDTTRPEFVSGIIDFGDVVESVRVADVAVAISYLLNPGQREWEEIEHFLDGFSRHVRLDAEELLVLKPLVAARFAARIVINQHLARGNPDSRGDAAAAAQVNRQALASLLEKL